MCVEEFGSEAVENTPVYIDLTLQEALFVNVVLGGLIGAVTQEDFAEVVRNNRRVLASTGIKLSDAILEVVGEESELEIADILAFDRE